MFTRFKNTALGLLLIAVFGFWLNGCGSSEASYEYDTFAAAQEASDGAPILIDFYTDWCRYCKMMDTTTFEDSAVVDYIKGNILVAKVNAEVDSSLARSYNVTGYPTMVLVEPDGNEIDRFIGYYPPEKFLPTLTAWVSGEGTFAELQQRALNATDPTVSVELADKYLQRGQMTDAIEVLDRALTMSPSDSLASMIMLRQADANFRAQNYNEAMNVLSAVIADYPNSIGAEQAGFARGIMYERMGDTTAAVGAYKDFLATFPESEGGPQVRMRIQMLQSAQPQN